jgi:hypothetical protein
MPGADAVYRGPVLAWLMCRKQAFGNRLQAQLLSGIPRQLIKQPVI